MGGIPICLRDLRCLLVAFGLAGFFGLAAGDALATAAAALAAPLPATPRATHTASQQARTQARRAASVDEDVMGKLSSSPDASGLCQPTRMVGELTRQAGVGPRCAVAAVARGVNGVKALGQRLARLAKLRAHALRERARRVVIGAWHALPQQRGAQLCHLPLPGIRSPALPPGPTGGRK